MQTEALHSEAEHSFRKFAPNVTHEPHQREKMKKKKQKTTAITEQQPCKLQDADADNTQRPNLNARHTS